MPQYGRRPTASAEERMEAEAGSWDTVRGEIPHFIASSTINVVSRNPYVFIATFIGHAGYHLYQHYAGAGQSTSVNEVVEAGGIVYPELKGWTGQPEVIPHRIGGKRIYGSKVASFRRCRTTSRLGRRCTRRLGHPMPHRF